MYVLITGAAGGLGRSFAAECASRGYDLLLTDINEDGLQAVKTGLLRRFDVAVHTLRCDITSKEDVASLVRYARDNHIRLDMLFNVAGVDFEGSFTQRSFDQISSILRLNIEATLRVTYEALSLRRQGGRFTVIFVSSLASLYPMPLKATYAASKRFLLDFSIALGQELKGQNVQILSLCPAGLTTSKEAIQGIAAQGFWGSVTTNKLERVVRVTIDRALRGKKLYIPGALNRTFSLAARLLPPTFIAKVLLWRWTGAQKKWLTDPGHAKGHSAA